MKTTLTILLLALAAPAAGQTRVLEGKNYRVESTGPRPTPAAGAAILRPNQYVATCDRCDGPYVTIVGGGPSLGPWDAASGMGPTYNSWSAFYGMAQGHTAYCRYDCQAFGEDYWRQARPYLGDYARTHSRRTPTPFGSASAFTPSFGASFQTDGGGVSRDHPTQSAGVGSSREPQRPR